MAKIPLIAQKSQSVAKECDYTNSTITVNGMGGYEGTIKCTGLPIKVEDIMFASDRNIVSLMYQAQTTEFEKYNADFNNTINTLSISNAVKSFNPLVELQPQNTSLNPASTTMQTASMTPQNLPPPMQQIRTGIVPSYVKCNQGFTLIYKAEDDSPVCVTVDDATKLIQIGWAKQ